MSDNAGTQPGATAGPNRPDTTPPTGESHTLSETECRELLRVTTVGRIGFLHRERVQIIPVNYAVSSGDVIIRTSATGILAPLADGVSGVAFEVDFHDNTSGSGWSVLMNGWINGIAEGEVSTVAGLPGIVPWAGGPRSLYLRFVPEEISGRRVRRRRR